MSTYKTKAKKNVIVSVIFKIIILITGLLSRRFMMNFLGTEITGIYSLFVSILGFLAVAELGIGSAIIFSMYKPIVDNDKDKVSALYYLYKKFYLVIFIVIVVVGGIIIPFLPKLAKEYTIGNEIYTTYVIFLVSTSITYLYACRTSLINAHMDNYITNSIRSIFLVIEYIVQIVIIYLTGSFILFLIVLLCSNISQWVTTNLIFHKHYKYKINNNKELTDDIKKSVVEKSKAMLFHKIGGLLVSTTDNIIISAFIGVTLLGIYSNYVLIINSMVGILSLFFISITSVLGHIYATRTKQEYEKRYNLMYLLNYLISVIFFLGFYSISDEIILILFNSSVVLPKNVIVILTINHFLYFSKKAANSFRDASGIFYYDRYRPIFEGITNLILSLLLVKNFGISGVLIATIFTNVFINHIVEPYVLYKYAFNSSPKKYYYFNYLGILLFSIILISFDAIPIPKFNNLFFSLVVKGSLSILISFVYFMILYFVSKSFRKNLKLLLKEGTNFIKSDQI